MSQACRSVPYFVKAGFSIEDRNSGGETPFLNAAKRHEPRSRTPLQILWEQGADPTTKDNEGRGALHLAIENFWKDTNGFRFWKANSLTVPERCQFLKEKLLFLLQAGCDPGAEDNEGFTVNDYAETEGLSGVWELVLFNFNIEKQKTKS